VRQQTTALRRLVSNLKQLVVHCPKCESFNEGPLLHPITSSKPHHPLMRDIAQPRRPLYSSFAFVHG